MRHSKYILAAMILIAFIAAIMLYQHMPEKMATHWNADGDADGYSGRLFGLFFLPILTGALAIFFFLIPRIDPLKKNIDQFKSSYEWFMIIFAGFMLYIYAATILWNFGYLFSMLQAMSPAFGVLFYSVGMLTENSKKNWFIGIRNPWTLSSDEVWNRTHKIGGRLFKIAGFICAMGLFIPNYILVLIFVPIILIAVFTMAYSYWLFQKLKREGKIVQQQDYVNANKKVKIITKTKRKR